MLNVGEENNFRHPGRCPGLHLHSAPIIKVDWSQREATEGTNGFIHSGKKKKKKRDFGDFTGKVELTYNLRVCESQLSSPAVFFFFRQIHLLCMRCAEVIVHVPAENL